jgi:membrane protein required for colicin V production
LPFADIWNLPYTFSPSMDRKPRCPETTTTMALDGYDMVMLGILAATAVLGYFKGMVWQLAWIAGIAASGFVALRFGNAAAPFFGQQAPWNRLIAMLALYVGTSLVVWLVFRVVSGAIDAVHLSAFDHQLGLLLGLAKGALLCVVITFFAVTLAPGFRDQIVASRSGRIVAEVIVRADEFLPAEVAATVDPFVKQFEERLRGGPGPLPAAAVGNAGGFAGVGAGGPVGGGPSPLQAIWEGVTSAAAWTGAEQGGQGGQQAAGWPMPPHAAQQTGFPPPPPRPTASGFTARPQPPGPFQPVPQQPYPVGAQSPLPTR